LQNLFHMEKLLFPELDGLKKHNKKNMCKVVRPNKVVGLFYVDQDNPHVCNENICCIMRYVSSCQPQ
jgi:hypothetical protein